MRPLHPSLPEAHPLPLLGPPKPFPYSPLCPACPMRRQQVQESCSKARTPKGEAASPQTPQFAGHETPGSNPCPDPALPASSERLSPSPPPRNQANSKVIHYPSSLEGSSLLTPRAGPSSASLVPARIAPCPRSRSSWRPTCSSSILWRG